MGNCQGGFASENYWKTVLHVFEKWHNALPYACSLNWPGWEVIHRNINACG